MPIAAKTLPPRAGVETGSVSRINVTVDQKRDLRYWLRQPVALSVIGLAFLSIVVALFAVRSSFRNGAGGNGDARAEAAVSPTPEASPTPTPDPTPTEEVRDASRHREAERENRNTRQQRTPARQRQREQPSKLGKIKNTLKKIFKNPF
jgi:hypothetical protein